MTDEQDTSNKLIMRMAKFADSFPDEYTPTYWFYRLFWNDEKTKKIIAQFSNQSVATDYYKVPRSWRIPVLVAIFFGLFLLAYFGKRIGF